MKLKGDNFDYRDNINRVFSSAPGLYGAWQNYHKQHPEVYREQVLSYYPDYGEEQIQNLLIKLGSEGCYYAAVVNTVFLYLIDEQELFEEIFQLPMYNNKGELNINGLLLDFYLSMDNHNPLNLLFYKEDYVASREDESDVKGWGATNLQMKWRFMTYMKNHGIKVNMLLLRDPLKQYEKLSSKGPLLVSVRPNTLYDAKGNVAYDSSNAHAMTITGVMENGDVKVSSWGRPYYIKPGTYKKMEEYSQVIYKKIPRSKFKRWVIKHNLFPRPLWVKIAVWIAEASY